ncbi:HORMA-1 domain-containing protein, partial [Frankia casuarinae]
AQLQRYYGKPSDTEIIDLAAEATALAHGGHVDKVIYGFQCRGAWILTLEYVFVNGTLTTDDRAGGVCRHADVVDATFTSYLIHSPAWWRLDAAIRDTIEKSLPIVRTPAAAPGYSGGFHTTDRTYSAQGTGFTRSSYRPL